MPRLGNGLWNWLGCSTLLAVGCAHTNPPPVGMAPAPGGIPATGGCSSCGSSPISAMPHYGPPTPAPPPLVTQPGVLGSPVVTNQVQFRPCAPVAHFGSVIVDEPTTVPLPPTDVPATPGESDPAADSKLSSITSR